MNFYVSLLFLSICAASCAKLWGDTYLNNGFHLLEGDKKEDRIIVYNNSNDWIKYSGSFVIPLYNEHMKDGHYEEYVESAKSNDKWIVAKTVLMSTGDNRFWILESDLYFENANMDSSILANRIGPLTFEEFKKKKDSLGITLNF